MKLNEVKVQWKVPDFEHEYNEVLAQPEIKKHFKSKRDWITKAMAGDRALLTPAQVDALQNHTPAKEDWETLDTDKRDRVHALFSKGSVELPIILYDTEQRIMHLLSGNTRLNYARNHGFPCAVWVINVTGLQEQ